MNNANPILQTNNLAYLLIRKIFYLSKAEQLTDAAMLPSPAGLANANSFLTMAVSGAVGYDAFRLTDVTFGSFPAVDTVALTSAIHSVTTAQKRTHTCKKCKKFLNIIIQITLFSIFVIDLPSPQNIYYMAGLVSCLTTFVFNKKLIILLFVCSE